MHYIRIIMAFTRLIAFIFELELWALLHSIYNCMGDNNNHWSLYMTRYALQTLPWGPLIIDPLRATPSSQNRGTHKIVVMKKSNIFWVQCTNYYWSAGPYNYNPCRKWTRPLCRPIGPFPALWLSERSWFQFQYSHNSVAQWRRCGLGRG